MKFPRPETLAGWIGLFIAHPLAWVLRMALQLLMLTVWAWTGVLGFGGGGVFGALLALGTPIVSQIFFICYSHLVYGSWITTYSLTVASVPVIYALAIGMALVAGWSDESEERAAELRSRRFREASVSQRASA